MMLPEQRRLKILELLQEDGSARVSYLSRTFDVSEPTIRQDLEKLEADGYIMREHGGAFLKSIPQQVGSLSLQHQENMDKNKKRKEFEGEVSNVKEPCATSRRTLTLLKFDNRVSLKDQEWKNLHTRASFVHGEKEIPASLPVLNKREKVRGFHGNITTMSNL